MAKLYLLLDPTNLDLTTLQAEGVSLLQYVLARPELRAVRYLGLTNKTLIETKAGHLAFNYSRSVSPEMTTWIAELIQAEREPLCILYKDQALPRQKSLEAQRLMDRGHELYNRRVELKDSAKLVAESRQRKLTETAHYTQNATNADPVTPYVASVPPVVKPVESVRPAVPIPPPPPPYIPHEEDK